MTGRPRFGIRATIYRRRPGFLVYSIGAPGWPTRIVVPSRRVAEHVRAQCRAGRDITLADFKEQP